MEIIPAWLIEWKKRQDELRRERLDEIRRIWIEAPTPIVEEKEEEISITIPLR